jgi:hypothetical protein
MGGNSARLRESSCFFDIAIQYTRCFRSSGSSDIMVGKYYEEKKSEPIYGLRPEIYE